MRKNVRRAIYTCSGPEVKPTSRREIDVAVLNARSGDGSHEQGITAQELVFHRVGRGIFRIGPEQWTQNGRSRAVTFIEERVEIRQKALPELEHFTRDRLIGLAKHPGLLVARLFFRVIATEGLENSEFRPAGKKLPSC